MSDLIQKWKPLLETEGLPQVSEDRQEIVATVLDTTEREMKKEGWLTEANVTGAYDNVYAGTKNSGFSDAGPAVMGMLRRSMPSLMMFDIMGVQPLTQPTGQVFTMRAVYGGDSRAVDATEANHPFQAPRAGWSGVMADPAFNGGNSVSDLTGGQAYAVGDVFKFEVKDTGVRYYQVITAFTADADADVAFETAYTAASIAEVSEGMACDVAELQENFDGSSGNAWNEMSFRIDKQAVEAKNRQLKTQYSLELAQDLANVHGMDADAELMNILTYQIQAEMDREAVISCNTQAQIGKSGNTGNGTTPGVFDLTSATDVRGARWLGEAYKMLMVQIEKEANEIGRQTGLGNGNFIVASRNVVSALAQTSQLIGPGGIGAQEGLSTDTTNGVFAGVLAGRFRVYIDQFAEYDYITVGLKGSNMNAGLIYSPYVGLYPVRGADSKNFQPVMGLKTRYAVSINPFAVDGFPASGQTYANPLARGIGQNAFYRRFLVKGV